MSNTARKRILLISISNLRSDPRVLAHASVLLAFGDLTTIGFGEKPEAVHDHLELTVRRAPLRTLLLLFSLIFRLHRLSGQLLGHSSQISRFMREISYNIDLICANDANSLFVAKSLSKKLSCPIWVDMHEYAPLENEGSFKWRLLIKPFATAACQAVLPKVDVVSTVGRGIQVRYESESGRSVDLIRNTAAFAPRLIIPERSTSSDNIFRLVHVGVAIRARLIENMFEAIRDLDKVSLDLYLLPTDLGYFKELLGLSKRQSNIYLREPVPTQEIVSSLSQFDCGVITIPPTNFNYANCLPNKFFQYVQARIPVITGPIPEVAEIVNGFGVGWVCEDFSPSSIRSTVQLAREHNRVTMADNLDSAAHEFARQHDDDVRNKIVRQLLANSRKVFNSGSSA